MNEDILRKMADQARDLQQRIGEAIAKGHEQAQPYLEQAMKQAGDLRETIVKQARESANVTHDQTNQTLTNLDAAMKSSTEATKPLMDSFFAKAREAADQASKAFEK